MNRSLIERKEQTDSNTHCLTYVVYFDVDCAQNGQTLKVSDCVEYFGWPGTQITQRTHILQKQRLTQRFAA